MRPTVTLDEPDEPDKRGKPAGGGHLVAGTHLAASVIATHSAAAKLNSKVAPGSVRRRLPGPPAVRGVAGNAAAFGAMMDARRQERAQTHDSRQEILSTELHR